MITTVIKRNGSSEDFNPEKINSCVQRVSGGLDNISVSEVVIDIQNQLYNNITTAEIDRALVMVARSKIEKDPEYGYLAARLLLNSLYKEVFQQGVNASNFDTLYRLSFELNLTKLVHKDIYHKDLLQKFDIKRLKSALKPERDLKFNYIGIQTLYDRYFIKDGNLRMETPQAFFMRVAMGLSFNEKDPTESAVKIYNMISEFRFMPSTPTLFNSGTKFSQLSSCYGTTIEDSIEGIFNALTGQALLSKHAGGLGFDFSNVRATGSKIKGTNGVNTQGIVAWLKIYNDMLISVDQSSKRPGAGCAYLEPWHLDHADFLQLRKNTGEERRRTHDLNTANWIPELFMRLKDDPNADWYLFSPSDVPNLHESFGEDFEKLYYKYVDDANKGLIKNFKIVKAKDVWRSMLRSIFETGHPWMTFKDACNERYTNSHEGPVLQSNLCTEITLHTKPSLFKNSERVAMGETFVCNLSSINLVEHIDPETKQILWDKLAETIQVQIRSLDNVIDLNYYPIPEAEKSNLLHRPVGAGIMGWHDLLHTLEIPFSSEEAVVLADKLHEFISYHSIFTSSKLAEERGRYQTFEGSKWSKGLLPIDTYKEFVSKTSKIDLSDLSLPTEPKWYPKWTLDWDSLRTQVKTKGMRNSNVMAIAPTATIGYIVGVEQSIEPNYSMLFSYQNKSGDILIVNKFFVDEMKKLGVWSPVFREALKKVDGNPLKLQLPDKIKERFRRAFDQDQFLLIRANAARQKWIDQAISMNLYNNTESMKYLDEIYTSAFKHGLKTTYYLRNLAATAKEKTSVSTTQNEFILEDSVNNSGTFSTDEKLDTAKACFINDPTCEACQ